MASSPAQGAGATKSGGGQMWYKTTDLTPETGPDLGLSAARTGSVPVPVKNRPSPNSENGTTFRAGRNGELHVFIFFELRWWAQKTRMSRHGVCLTGAIK